MIDDDASRIVDQRSEEPSSTIEPRSEEALGDGHNGSGALLGLELTTVEKSGQNPALNEDSKQFAAQSPLLGTNSLKSLSQSSNGRSTQRVCNDLLLRFGSSVEARKSQNSAENRARGCYGFTPENLPKGMCIRGGQFYYRRNVPKDAQGLIGRTEIWRSLRTDSLRASKYGLLHSAEKGVRHEPDRWTMANRVGRYCHHRCDHLWAEAISQAKSEPEAAHRRQLGRHSIRQGH